MSLLSLFNQHKISVSDGIELFAVDSGDTSKPSIVFLHGYPDEHQVWSYQMLALAKDYHVVSFDLRGMGKSSAPSNTSAYQIKDILEDITCVIKTLVGVNKKVHLVGHDWGSIIGWHFVTHPDYSKQYVLSYSSMSGPHLGMASQYLQKELRSGKVKRMLNSLMQVVKSWYIGFFQLPILPEKLIQSQGLKIWKSTLKNNGVRALDAYVETANEADVIRLMTNGLNLYRSNFQKKLYKPPKKKSVQQPVLLFIAKNDVFLAPSTFDNIEQYAENTTRVEMQTGHWIMRQEPDDVTRKIHSFIQTVEMSY